MIKKKKKKKKKHTQKNSTIKAPTREKSREM